MTLSQHAFESRYDQEFNLDYLLYLPPDYDADTTAPYPLIMFLHGAGERSHDLSGVLTQGIPKRLSEGDDLPFIVIAPQCPPDQTWFDYRNELILLLDHVLEQHNVDPDRVYLTGLSMGGFGTWDLARLHPDRFAAIAPICGGLPWLVALGSAALTLRTMPVWAFHGALDDIVPIERSQEAVDALRAAGNDVRFTVYPDLKHDSWTISYANPELYTWFLEHRIERA